LRELAGTGAILANMDRLLPINNDWTLIFFTTESPFLLAILPPGAFLFMGLLIALKNLFDRKMAVSTNQEPEAVEPGSKRVRVTG